MRAQQDERKKRIDQKKAELDARPNPYTKEIETCQDLIKYCQKLKQQAGLVPPTSEEVAVAAQASFHAEQSRAELEQKLKDGKIQAAVTKKDDMMVVGGGGKGKKGKKQKNQQNAGQNNQAASFQVDFYQIKMFGLVLLSPPLGPEDLDEKLAELKKKTDEYLEEGEKQLKKDRAEIEQQIEQEVDEDLERDRRAAEGFDDEDDEYGDEDGGYDDGREASKAAGRSGGRGRGGRPGDRDARRRRAPKGEFEASDDDDDDDRAAANDPYSKPSRGGGMQVNAGKRGGHRQGGKNKMEFNNDDDFPAL